MLARIPEAELRRAARRLRHHVHVVAGDEPEPSAPAAGRRPGRRASTRSTPSSERRPGTRRHRPAAVADDRVAHPQGLDRPQDRGRAAGRGHVARPPGAPRPRCASNPAHLATARGVAARPTGPRSCSTRTGRSMPELAALPPRGRPADERQPARQRRPAAARPGAARLPRLRRRRSTSPGATVTEATRVLGALAARRHRPQPRPLPAVRPGRDRLQPAAGRLRGHRPGLGGADPPGDDHLAPDGPGDGGAVGAPVPGLAGGLPADRPARHVQLLRGVHPHHRLDVQPARQMAQDHQRRSPGAARSRRSTTCCPRTSGARTTTASRTRTPASSTTSSTRRPRSSGSTCRPTPTACCRWPTTACARRTTST